MEEISVKTVSPPIFQVTGENLFREFGTMRPLKRHHLIYSPGDTATHLYMIGHGDVKISRYTSEGRELTLGHLGPNDIFGEGGILLDRPHQSQAVTRTESVVYSMEREALEEMIDRHPRLGIWLSRLMSQRQARMEERLESLLFKSANGKVAQVLLGLANDHGEKVKEGTLITYPITHQEIGSLIATTRETVSYAFMELRRLGLISTCRRRTIVHDLEQLGLAALS